MNANAGNVISNPTTKISQAINDSAIPSIAVRPHGAFG